MSAAQPQNKLSSMEEIFELIGQIEKEIGKVILGQPSLTRTLLIALFTKIR